MIKLPKRAIEDQIMNSHSPNKAIVLLGPGRIGKTVPINQILRQVDIPFLFLNEENVDTRRKLAYRSTQNCSSKQEGIKGPDRRKKLEA